MKRLLIYLWIGSVIWTALIVPTLQHQLGWAIALMLYDLGSIFGLAELYLWRN